MRPETYSTDSIVHLLRRQLIATMDEVKDALGTHADVTVFRKLSKLDYLSSYSHGGRYYTLRELAQFDDRGLWDYRGVHFCCFGSLLETAEAFVNRADRGLFAAELAAELRVETKEALLRLVREKRLAREQVCGLYLYCSASQRRRREQLVGRKLAAVGAQAFESPREGLTDSDNAKAAVAFFMTLLDERQRRLFAALESVRLGRGGDQAVARATGMDPHTIAKGRHELLERDLQLDRLRRPGGGRKTVEKKHLRSSPKSKS